MRLVLLPALTVLPVAGAHQETFLPAERAAHAMVLRQVHLNGQGPFRMMIDTGAAASAIRPEVARRIGVAPGYRVEQVTAAGVSVAPAGRLSVRAGEIEDAGIEFIFSPLGFPGIDGVLGQNWLSLHSYRLDFQKRRVTIDGEPPLRGLRMDLKDADGRPGITARIDGVAHELVLDSGASILLLFREDTRYRNRVSLTTHTGSIEGSLGEATVAIGGGFLRRMPVAELAARRGSGLLPASVFRSVYVGKGRKTAVLVP